MDNKTIICDEAEYLIKNRLTMTVQHFNAVWRPTALAIIAYILIFNIEKFRMNQLII